MCQEHFNNHYYYYYNVDRDNLHIDVLRQQGYWKHTSWFASIHYHREKHPHLHISNLSPVSDMEKWVWCFSLSLKAFPPLQVPWWHPSTSQTSLQGEKTKKKHDFVWSWSQWTKTNENKTNHAPPSRAPSIHIHLIRNNKPISADDRTINIKQLPTPDGEDYLALKSLRSHPLLKLSNALWQPHSKTLARDHFSILNSVSAEWVINAFVSGVPKRMPPRGDKSQSMINPIICLSHSAVITREILILR